MTALSRWLQAELPRRGYAPGSKRSGISKFAADVGISQPTASRTVNGSQEPTLATLRKLSEFFNVPLGKLMVLAEVATPEDLRIDDDRPEAPEEGNRPWEASPPDDLPAGIIWSDLSPTERYIFHAPLLPPDVRAALAGMADVYLSGLERADRIRQGLDEESAPRGANSA